MRARAQSSTGACGWTALIAALGTAALGAAFVFDFVADQTERHHAEVATTLAYPLGDIVSSR